MGAFNSVMGTTDQTVSRPNEKPLAADSTGQPFSNSRRISAMMTIANKDKGF